MTIKDNPPWIQNTGNRLREFGYLDGGYIQTCRDCDSQFIGAKRCCRCFACADQLSIDSAKEVEYTKDRNDQLKPCPLCSGKAYYKRKGTTRVSNIVSCEDCGCTLETSETFKHWQQWNNRH